MYERDTSPAPGSGLGIAAVLAGAVLGAAALLLSTKQGQMLLEKLGVRADDWKSQAAAALAETREKVVSAVESQADPTDFSEGPGPQVRQNL